MAQPVAGIRIFIVDDHQIMIDGIKALIGLDKSLVLVGETIHPLQVGAMLQQTPTDVLIADINMPEMNGIQLTRQLKTQIPDIKVLALTMYDDKQTIAQMLDAGVSGYVLKNTGKEELINAIKSIAAGRLFFTDQVAQTILAGLTQPKEDTRKEEELPIHLTTREKEIVKLIGEEKNNAEIGNQLFISERTVETHRKNIFRKTNTKSVAGLIRYAISAGIID